MITGMVAPREEVTNILIIKLRGIGDVLLSTVVIRNLRAAYPDARLDFLTEPAACDVVRGNEDLSEILVFDRKALSGLDLIRLVRSRSYSMVIDLFGNPRTALVTRLSGAKFRVGYRFRGRTYAYNHVVTPRGGAVHNTQFNLDAVEHLGIAIQDRKLYFPIDQADERTADRFFAEQSLTVGEVGAVNSSGGWYTKRWSTENFAALGRRIFSRYGIPLIVTWGPEEEEAAKRLQELIGQGAVSAPPTRLKELGALLRRCRFLISNDNGPMHIAAAVGTPVLGVYGPTNPVLQGPYGDSHMIVRNEQLDCLGCNLTSCPIGHPCMKDLSMERVGDAFDQFLKRLP